jgi:UDP-N-acetylmuramyl pentapeptide phosphotransferase/UDP-N-acetylglucosamine-1-phosphate transferase
MGSFCVKIPCSSRLTQPSRLVIVAPQHTMRCFSMVSCFFFILHFGVVIKPGPVACLWLRGVGVILAVRYKKTRLSAPHNGRGLSTMETLNALTGIGPALVSGFLACFAVCVLLVITQRWHGLWSLDADAGVQKLHINPTPRVGGIAIATGLLVSWLALPEGPIGDEVRLLSSQLLWAAVPAFVAGLLEDLTKKIGVRSRLLATCASGLLAALLTGYAVSRVHVPGFDWLLAFAPVAFLFTAFAVGGVANSINIIDGLNGLASGVVVLMLLALGVLSYQVGDETLLIMSAMAGVVFFGFMLYN